MMHGQGKSDSSIVPGKSPNNAAFVAAETMEGRDGAKGNAVRGSTCQTQSWESVSLALGRIRETARRDKRVRFTALLHHVTVDLLHWSFYQLERHAAVGIDGLTWDRYEDGLESNLIDLCARVHSGAYRAKPSRRQYIPKPDGRQRPLGIASLEDKIVQRAVAELLNAIYETDFLGFSYGFRPKRSQHDALDALATAIYRKKVNWILDADIQAFFDTVNWEWLVRFLEHRIADRRILRLIGKWLKAGVLEDGRLLAVERGTPQGAVISPVLANIYLHYVYDLWVNQWRRQSGIGEVIVVRYADDTVVGFQRRSDAERFLDELRQRLKKFGLELNPQKTRIIEFGRFAERNRKAQGLGKPETFAFLGFTHICGTSKVGGYLILRHTIRKRLREKIKQVKETIRRMRHRPIAEQIVYLKRVMNGFFNYFAVPTNNRAINAFYYYVTWYWCRALRRRSQTSRLTWQRMKRLIDHSLPSARLRHPLPDVRFRVMTRGGSPVR